MGFTSCVADPDVWRRPAVKPEGTDYYEYVMNYVDKIIAVYMDAVGILEEIARFEKLNNDNIDPPLDFLGAFLLRRQLIVPIYGPFQVKKVSSPCSKMWHKD